MKLYTTEFIRRLAQKNRRSQDHYAQALEEIFDGIKEALAEGHTLHLTGFGSFVTHSRKEQQVQVKSIHGGQLIKVKIPAHRYVAFHVGSLLRKAVFKRGLLSRLKGKKR